MLRPRPATPPDFFSETFERLLSKLNLPRIPPLTIFGHTHTNLLVEAGVPIKGVVSEHLGQIGHKEAFNEDER